MGTCPRCYPKQGCITVLGSPLIKEKVLVVLVGEVKGKGCEPLREKEQEAKLLSYLPTPKENLEVSSQCHITGQHITAIVSRVSNKGLSHPY